MVTFVRDQWHPNNRIMLGSALAVYLDMFGKTFGGATAFAGVPYPQQAEYFQKLTRFSEKLKADSDALPEGAKRMETIAQHVANQFFSVYVMALIMKDQEWEGELASQLDQFISEGLSGPASLSFKRQ